MTTATQIFEIAGAIILSVGGAGAVLLGLSSYVGKIWAQRILAQDRQKYETELEALKSRFEASNRELQGEIDKTIHIHRLHFETEFGALRSVWEKMAKMRRMMSSLRPMFSAGPVLSEEEESAQMQQRFSVFTDAFSDAINCVDDHRPFLTEELHTTISAALQAAKAEHFDIRMRWQRRKDDLEWYERGKANYDKVEARLGDIANLIRARLRELAIYPE